MENSSLLQSGPRGLRTREQARHGETRSGAAGETATRGQNCACGTRHANFWPPPRAIVASMKRAAHQRPMPTRARLTASARGDGLIPVQRTRRTEGDNQARPPFSRARAWASGRFPAFRAYLKTGEPSSNTSHHETGQG
jgi:hypothetical protein